MILVIFCICLDNADSRSKGHFIDDAAREAARKEKAEKFKVSKEAERLKWLLDLRKELFSNQ